MEQRELTCIGCPLGCPLTVTLENRAVQSVQGNTCPRGDAYARKEVTAPTRIVTSTVRATVSSNGSHSTIVSNTRTVSQSLFILLTKEFYTKGNPSRKENRRSSPVHSTVTDFARLRGWSISQPRRRATW